MERGACWGSVLFCSGGSDFRGGFVLCGFVVVGLVMEDFEFWGGWGFEGLRRGEGERLWVVMCM